jgi:hypothetical protein
LIVRHHALRISQVFRVAWRFRAVAATAKIGTDDGKSLGKDWRNAMPADMRLRVAMQQQNWTTATASNKIDGSFWSCDSLTSETSKHGHLLFYDMDALTKQVLYRRTRSTDSHLVLFMPRLSAGKTEKRPDVWVSSSGSRAR